MLNYFWFPLYILVLLILLFAALEADPSPVIHILAKIKRAKRRSIIKQEGKWLGDLFEVSYRRKAKAKGYSDKEIDEVLKIERNNIRQKFGKTSANKILGLPDEIERTG